MPKGLSILLFLLYASLSLPALAPRLVSMRSDLVAPALTHRLIVWMVCGLWLVGCFVDPLPSMRWVWLGTIVTAYLGLTRVWDALRANIRTHHANQQARPFFANPSLLGRWVTATTVFSIPLAVWGELSPVFILLGWSLFIAWGLIGIAWGLLRTPSNHGEWLKTKPRLMYLGAGFFAVSILLLIAWTQRLNAQTFSSGLSLLCTMGPALLAWGDLGAHTTPRYHRFGGPIIGVGIATIACAAFALSTRLSMWTLACALILGWAAWATYHWLVATPKWASLSTAQSDTPSWTEWVDAAASFLLPLAQKHYGNGGPLWIEALALNPRRHIRVTHTSATAITAEHIPDNILECIRQQRSAVIDTTVLGQEAVRFPSSRPLLTWLETKHAILSIIFATPDGVDALILLAAEQVPKRPFSHDLGLHIEAWKDQQHDALRATLAYERVHNHLDQAHRKIKQLEEIAEHAEQTRSAAMRLMHYPIWICDTADEPITAVGPFLSPAMQACERRVQALAKVNTPKRIVGEPGTEVLACARLLHARSQFADGPLIVINAAQYPNDQWLGRLVGAAGPHQASWLSLALQGTLVIENALLTDKVLQMQLSHIFASHRFRETETGQEYPVECQIIFTDALTDIPNPADTADASVTAIWSWLSESTICLPPLRERREDLEALITREIASLCHCQGIAPLGIEPAALQAMLAHPWPGNRSQLKLALQVASRRASGKQIKISDLIL